MLCLLNNRNQRIYYMQISMIAAMAKNRVIGKNGQLPWHLPKDLQLFKKITTGKNIVMGRKTFESIGRPLPNRNNIILTHDETFCAVNCEIVHSIDEILQKYQEDIIIIGGGEIYKSFLPLTSKIYLSIIDCDTDGDTYFPELNKHEWEFKLEQKYPKDEQNSHSFSSYTITKLRS